MSGSKYIELELLEKLNETLSELNEMQKVHVSTGRTAAVPYSAMASKIVDQVEQLSIEIREDIKKRNS